MAKDGNICDSNPYYTLEFTGGGSYMKIGYYKKTLHVDNEYEHIYMNLKHLKEIYNDHKKYASDYDLINFNCKDWAEEVYNKIKEKY